MSDRVEMLAGRLRKEADHRAASAAGQLAARADADGVLDVAFTRAESPIGRLLLAATERGLARVAFLERTSEEEALVRLSEAVSPRILEAPERFDGVRRQLDEYFAGRRRRFDLEVDWGVVRGFHRAVLDATAALAYGETLSYAEVARRAGRPGAHRAAGSALNRNPVPVVVPCHRILRTGGGLGGYGGGLETKEHLLRLEGAL